MTGFVRYQPLPDAARMAATYGGGARMAVVNKIEADGPSATNVNLELMAALGTRPHLGLRGSASPFSLFVCLVLRLAVQLMGAPQWAYFPVVAVFGCQPTIWVIEAASRRPLPSSGLVS